MIFLEKEVGKDFTVLNLTDVHIVYDDIKTISKDYLLLQRTVKELVYESSPDLITISGDFSFADDIHYIEVYGEIGAFIESFGIPWAVLWGNHDNQGGSEHIINIVKLFGKFPHFIYESGEKKLGNGNYIIAIKEKENTVAAIILMDTHDRVDYTNADGKTVQAWAKLTPEQLSWYSEQIERNNLKSTVLITHIPIYAYKEAFKEAFNDKRDPKTVTLDESYDKSIWNDGYKDSFGVRYEDECCYPENEGALEMIEKMNSTKLVLCGHDHANCTSIMYHGVRLMYSLKTGSGCYWNKALNGGTVMHIHGDGSVDAGHISIKA